ncbi:hypothetical protein UCRPC4_g06321 [Phaeomoniella chlamydospora]|uniref:Uncharacterized protein n=1 Tax=Phaeomoniella chlamydospora TaxID=158046 RepID=A0A0G2FUF9_PHACM|nr:hypothetical protein UCRPC4_g06321 [Phaeomoniella chlamydospora]
MDSLKNFAEGVSNKPSNSNQQQSNTAGSGQQDYLDKGVEFAEKKFGGGKIDPNKSRGINEKVTDAGREYFEKATGKDIPDKFSN